jgi:hypothetical protein
MGRIADQVLRARGYDVDFSAGWDGVRGQDGTMLVSREELGGLANGVLAFANSQDAAPKGALATPRRGRAGAGGARRLGDAIGRVLY